MRVMLRVAVLVGVTLMVRVTDRDFEMLAVMDNVGDDDGVSEIVGVFVAVKDTVGVMEAVSDSVGVSEPVNDMVGETDPVSDTVGDALGVTEGVALGSCRAYTTPLNDPNSSVPSTMMAGAESTSCPVL